MAVRNICRASIGVLAVADVRLELGEEFGEVALKTLEVGN